MQHVTIVLPPVLRRKHSAALGMCDRSQGSGHVEVAATTVRSALVSLHRQHPLIYQELCNETGAVRQHINLFVNDDCIDKSELEHPLESGDILSILTAVSGG